MKTIDEWAPKWSELFDKIVKENLNEYDANHFMHSLGLNMGKPHLCTVGEAHGWTSAYSTEHYDDFFCKECTIFSANLTGFCFMNFLERLIEEKNAKFRLNWRKDPFIKKFEQHMVKHESDNWKVEYLGTI